MKVIILRHAARPAHLSGDCAITELGQAQAEKLASSIGAQGTLPWPTRLLCSPKQRTQQTLAPMARTAQLSIEIDARLDERHHRESAREFEERIRNLIDDLSDPAPVTPPGQREPCIYLCTHFDWLMSGALLIPSDGSADELDRTWGNCEYLIFKVKSGLWEVVRGGIIT